MMKPVRKEKGKSVNGEYYEISEVRHFKQEINYARDWLVQLVEFHTVDADFM